MTERFKISTSYGVSLLLFQRQYNRSKSRIEFLQGPPIHRQLVPEGLYHVQFQLIRRASQQG
jgi:hypothetical protein